MPQRTQPSGPAPDSFLITTPAALGPLLREVRALKRLSQDELSEETGVTLPLIGMRENGKRVIPADDLILILKACGWRIRVERIPSGSDAGPGYDGRE